MQRLPRRTYGIRRSKPALGVSSSHSGGRLGFLHFGCNDHVRSESSHLGSFRATSALMACADRSASSRQSIDGSAGGASVIPLLSEVFGPGCSRIRVLLDRRCPPPLLAALVGTGARSGRSNTL